MLPPEKARWLITIIRKMERDAIGEDTRARADHAGRVAAERVWRDENPNDGVGGMSGNPYSHDDSARLEVAAKKRLEFEELADFTINEVLRWALQLK